MRFIRTLALWNNTELWEFFITYLFSLSKDKSLDIFYIEFPSSFLNNAKEKLLSFKNIYKLALQICVYLLKTDITLSLETLTKINIKHNHISLGDFEDLSKTLQNVHYSENINLVKLEKPKTQTEKIIFVLKQAIDFYPISNNDQQSLFRLNLLNSSFKNQLTTKVAKRFLISETIEKKQRKILWKLIGLSSSLGKSK